MHLKVVYTECPAGSFADAQQARVRHLMYIMYIIYNYLHYIKIHLYFFVLNNVIVTLLE